MTREEKLQLKKNFSEISSRAWTPYVVKPDDAVPDLFHYTDASGLVGILRSSSLWATHFQSLNDASEMQYGLKQQRDSITALVEKEPDKKRFLLSAMELLDSVLVDPVAPTPYVVSFCDGGNLLSQWREYGDRGAGFSIGFDLEKLSKLFRGTSVLKVTYDPAIQCDIVSKTIEEYWNLLQEWEKKCGRIEDHCRAELVSLLLTESATFKDPGFREEQEWRLVRLGEGSSLRKFRTGRFGVIPYIELIPPNGQKLPIKKVIQGPTADRTSAKHSVEML